MAVGIFGRDLRLAAAEDSQPDSTRQFIFPCKMVQQWVTAVGAAVVLLAVIHPFGDDAGVWWYLGALAAVSAMAAVIALWSWESVYVFVSGLLINVIGLIAWLAWDDPLTLSALVQAQVVCLAAGSIGWWLIGRGWPAGLPDLQIAGSRLPYAHFASQAAVGLIDAFVLVAFTRELLNLPHLAIDPLAWLALGCAAAAMAICAWDRSARFPLVGLYALALAAVGMMTCAWGLPPRVVVWTTAANLTGFVIIMAVVGWALPRMRSVWQAVGIDDDPQHWSVGWFSPAQALLAIIGGLLAVWIAIDPWFNGAGQEHALLGLAGRLAGIPSGLMLVGAAILMAWQTDGRGQVRWQKAAFVAGLLFSCSLGWARLDLAAGTPTGDAPWLHRSVILLVSASMVTLFSGLGLPKMFRGRDRWIASGKSVSPAMGGVALAALLLVLIQEAALFDPQSGVPMTIAAVVIVAVALVLLTVVCLAFALVKDWDPLGLSDRGRTTYVYAAEVLAALVGLHLWLTMPWLFRLGIVERYWPLIVMGVAFAGAGLAELFERRGLPVLCEPLGRTALALPLAPALAAVVAWFVQSDEGLGQVLAAVGPSTWLVIGLFYGVLAVTKKSLWMAAASILTTNMGLWVLWHRQEWYFADHPQLWLIPVALAALVAEHLDRDRLDETQRTSLRYVALSVIYLSSMTEFWQTMGESFWLPLVTVLWAVAGMLLGMMLRIRSFLYIGFTCLLVVVVRLVYYAAFQESQMWVFWSSLIAWGLAIFALFALFEKRREQVLARVERFKEWEG